MLEKLSLLKLLYFQFIRWNMWHLSKKQLIKFLFLFWHRKNDTGLNSYTSGYVLKKFKKNKITHHFLNALELKYVSFDHFRKFIIYINWNHQQICKECSQILNGHKLYRKLLPVWYFELQADYVESTYTPRIAKTCVLLSAHVKGFVWLPVCRCWQVCLGLIRRWTNVILYIKLTVPLYRIWTQQRINSKIIYRCKNLKIEPELPRNFPKIPQNLELIVFLQIVVQMYISLPMQGELSLNFHRNNVYRHLEQGLQEQDKSKPIDWIESESRHMF